MWGANHVVPLHWFCPWQLVIDIVCVGFVSGFRKNTCLAWVENHIGRKTTSSFLMKGCTLFFWLLTQRSEPSSHRPLTVCFLLLATLRPAFPWLRLLRPVMALKSPVSRFPPHLRLVVLPPPPYKCCALLSVLFRWVLVPLCVSVFWSKLRSPVLTVACLAQLLVLAGGTVGCAHIALFLCSGTTMEGCCDNTNINISQWVSPVQCGRMRHRRTQTLSCVWYAATRWPLVATFKTSREHQCHKHKSVLAVRVHDGC